jgi:hypothetical protein
VGGHHLYLTFALLRFDLLAPRIRRCSLPPCEKPTDRRFVRFGGVGVPVRTGRHPRIDLTPPENHVDDCWEGLDSSDVHTSPVLESRQPSPAMAVSLHAAHK